MSTIGAIMGVHDPVTEVVPAHIKLLGQLSVYASIDIEYWPVGTSTIRTLETRQERVQAELGLTTDLADWVIGLELPVINQTFFIARLIAHLEAIKLRVNYLNSRQQLDRAIDWLRYCPQPTPDWTGRTDAPQPTHTRNDRYLGQLIAQFQCPKTALEEALLAQNVENRLLYVEIPADQRFIFSGRFIHLLGYELYERLEDQANCDRLQHIVNWLMVYGQTGDKPNLKPSSG